jgi:hypothetical protein
MGAARIGGNDMDDEGLPQFLAGTQWKYNQVISDVPAELNRRGFSKT